MAAIRHGIIKKDEVHASGARSAEAALLGTALRIPKKNVKVDEAEGERAQAWYASPLVPGRVAGTSSKPFEVRTTHVEPPRTPKQKRDDSAKKSAERTVEEVEADWKARLEEEKERAFAKGREAGLAEAKTQYDEDIAGLIEQFSADLNAVQHSWENFLHRTEPQLVQLAFRLARAVLDAPLPDHVRQIAERTVADAVERMATDVAVEIILHPVSYLRIQETGVEAQLNAIHSKLRWRTNPDLKQNEWIVQSPRAATRRIEAELIDELQRELSLRDVHQRDEVARGRRADAGDGDELTSGRVDELTGAELDADDDAADPGSDEDHSSSSPSPSSSPSS